MLIFELVEPRRLVGPLELRFGGLGKSEKIGGVPTPHGVLFTAELESFPRVGTDRFQHVEAGSACRDGGLAEKTLIQQDSDEIEGCWVRAVGLSVRVRCPDAYRSRSAGCATR